MFGNQHRKSIRLTINVMLAVGAFTASVSAQESDARALLNRMSAEIAGFESFIVSGDAYTDARLGAGHIIEHASEVTLRVQRPGMLRITNRDSENTTNIFFSGSVLSVHHESGNFYAQTNIPEGIESAVDFALNEVGIESPLLDFVARDLSGHLLRDAEEVRHLGTSLIRGSVYDHIAIRAPEVDLQIWIASEGRPLPGKMAISSKWEGGSPRFVVFLSWDTESVTPSESFTFTPPEDSTEIEFILDP
jgi:hypothetical protein